MVNLEFRLGQVVETKEGRQGTVRYIGTLQIATGSWLGLELPDASGKNDGSVKGERYFDCKPGHGIFVREESIVKIVKQPVPATAPRSNHTATAPNTTARPRPSTSISADVARKRQSLMSNGSGSAAGSRLSMRSPTKSPIKPTSTSASSTNSTPRNGTPSAAAKTAETTSKSRLSMGGRPSLGPLSGTTRSSSHTSRPSLGVASHLRSATAQKASASLSRPAIPASRLSQSTRSTASQEAHPAKVPVEELPEAQPQGVRSPTINEEIDEEEDDDTRNTSLIEERFNELQEEQADERPSDSKTALPEIGQTTTKAGSTSRTGGASNVETRTAQQRDIEQLKAKIRTLEKNRQEDRDKLKDVEKLQSDKNRFEGIIQALQKKLKTNQRELVELRSKCDEAEARANAVPERTGEQESEIELATLDKEMAEERAETCQLEFDALREKHEELELEVEILREENAELSASMSPGEKASAGWLQMQRETDRLRNALVILKDFTQDNEESLKKEITELRRDLDDAQKTADRYTETFEKLTRVEETNKHLMGQLEAAETNDEVVEAMEAEREQHLISIERLRNQIQDLEEHIQVTDELESFHVDEEKRLHAQLDESGALLSESDRRILEQHRIIEDLEYTLTKFRDVVQGLQSDIDQLRRSRDISELQANEMSSKSRAMRELNTRLHHNATKTQVKVIDKELNNVKAELASKHVDILNLFTPDMFETEKKPILTLLCFGRIRSKAKLVGQILSERLRERSHLSNDEEIFKTFSTMEHMDWLSASCDRFERYMATCDTQQFAAFSSVLAELEPVEQTVTVWIESLRRDELATNEPEHLKRMRNILMDLSEKMIQDTMETRATQHVFRTQMVENYSEILSNQFTTITRMVQAKLGPPTSENEESLVFDKMMDQLTTKAKTIRYLSGKASQQLADLRNDFLCLDETSWLLFEEAEQATEELTGRVRHMGLTLADQLFKPDPEDLISYLSVSKTMISTLQLSPQTNGELDDDPFASLSASLNSLQSLIDDLKNRSSDLNSAVKFESLPAPWVVRAKQIKNAKVISPEVQEELTRFERRNIELGSRIAEREKTIEEMSMRVELAEKRFKESKEKDNKDRASQEELDNLKSEKQASDQIIVSLQNELANAQSSMEASVLEIEALRNSIGGENLAKATVADVGNAGTNGTMDESLVKQFELEANLLEAQITSLQAAIRYLREENRSLRIPISEVLINSARNSWLDASISTRRSAVGQTTKSKLEREGLDVWTSLIDVAQNVQPIRLSSRQIKPSPSINTTNTTSTSWQPSSQTTRYAALKSREELERWEAQREDFIKRAKVAPSGARAAKVKTSISRTTIIPKIDGSNLTSGENHTGIRINSVKPQDDLMSGAARGVRIVDS